MSSKTKRLSAVSLILSVAVLVFCYSNFDGQISEPLRRVNTLSFYGVLGGPVVIAGIALVLAIMAWVSIQVIAALSIPEDSGDKVV